MKRVTLYCPVCQRECNSTLNLSRHMFAKGVYERGFIGHQDWISLFTRKAFWSIAHKHDSWLGKLLAICIRKYGRLPTLGELEERHNASSENT